MIQQHVTECKKIPFLAYALPIITVESNMHTIAQEVARTLKLSLRMKCQFMTEDKSKAGTQEDIPGSFTTRTNKLEMIQILINSYFNPRLIKFYENFVVTVSEGEEATSFINVKNEFVRELRDFSRIKKYKTTSEGTQIVQFFYNGKTKGANDDLVMALLIAVLMHRRFTTEDKYRNVRSSRL